MRTDQRGCSRSASTWALPSAFELTFGHSTVAHGRLPPLDFIGLHHWPTRPYVGIPRSARTLYKMRVSQAAAHPERCFVATKILEITFQGRESISAPVLAWQRLQHALERYVTSAKLLKRGSTTYSRVVYNVDRVAAPKRRNTMRDGD